MLIVVVNVDYCRFGRVDGSHHPVNYVLFCGFDQRIAYCFDTGLPLETVKDRHRKRY